MKSLSCICAITVAALLYPPVAGAAASAPGQAHAPVATVDYLGVPGPETVGGESYRLAFSAREGSGRVLQEYLPAGQALGSYTRMVMLDFLPGQGVSTLALAQRKLDETLARRGAGDPVANGVLMQAGDDPSSVVLDFLLSAPGADGKIIVEWNIYHYSSGAAGVLLKAWSQRAYGDEQAVALLKALKQQREQDLPQLVGWQPRVEPRP